MDGAAEGLLASLASARGWAHRRGAPISDRTRDHSRFSIPQGGCPQAFPPVLPGVVNGVLPCDALLWQPPPLPPVKPCWSWSEQGLAHEET